MEPTKRIIVNTGVQYIKAIITTCIALYSTRLVLYALNVSDYGIYSLIAGVVAMLGFITNALVVTTQRYLSFHRVNCSTGELRKLFTNSLFIHLVFGSVIFILLMTLMGIFFDQVLNIDPARVPTAKRIYIITVFMLLMTILTSPFKALFIAHENITFIVIIEILDSIIKFILAIALLYVTADKLLIYGWMNAAIVALNLLVFCVYALIKFPECAILIRRRDLDKSHIKMMTGFAGWTTYGMGCAAARNQGTAVVLNHFLGTTINAAYGIAGQVSSAISFLVSSITNAMNPQLMQAEGENNRSKMLEMAFRQSKFSTAILALVIIPLTAEMPAILDIWLKEVPAHTTLFCCFILWAFICDQMTLGLSSANQAIGNIRNFTLLTYTPKLLYIGFIWLMLKANCPVRDIMILYITIELAVSLVRIPYMHHKAGLDIRMYFQQVIGPLALYIAILVAASETCVWIFSFPLRFLITGIVAVLIGLQAGWMIILDKQEKEYIGDMIKKILKR